MLNFAHSQENHYIKMSNKRHLAVIFSDWHIHDYKRFNTNGSRLDNCLKVLFDLGDFCKKNGIKTILFAGDLYDTQKALLTNVVNDTVKAFVKFSEEYSDITIYAITGNHDQSTKNLIGKEAVSALSHIEAICPNFVVIDNTNRKIGDGIVVQGIPYYEYKEHFATKLNRASEIAKQSDTWKHYLLIHQTPEGIGNEMIPTDTNPRDEAYKPFEHVFCGHIHIHKRITEKFTLVGNPIHRDLADAGHKKGFLVMNLLAPENGMKFIELKGYPQFVRAFEDEDVDNEEQMYVVREPRLDEAALKEDANIQEFNTSLEAQDLLTNYWNEVDGKDKELLEIGIGFLPTHKLPSNADKSEQEETR